MIIKILGGGCASCDTLTENTKRALKELGMEAEIIKVTDFGKITDYGVMSTPALVIDEVVVSAGKKLSPKDIIKILKK